MAFFVQKNALEQVNARSTNDNIKKVPTLRNVDDFCQSIFWPSKSFTDPEAVVRTCSVKNAFLKIFQISQENNCCWNHLWNELQASDLHCY